MNTTQFLKHIDNVHWKMETFYNNTIGELTIAIKNVSANAAAAISVSPSDDLTNLTQKALNDFTSVAKAFEENLEKLKNVLESIEDLQTTAGRMGR